MCFLFFLASYCLQSSVSHQQQWLHVLPILSSPGVSFLSLALFFYTVCFLLILLFYPSCVPSLTQTCIFRPVLPPLLALLLTPSYSSFTHILRRFFLFPSSVMPLSPFLNAGPHLIVCPVSLLPLSFPTMITVFLSSYLKHAKPLYPVQDNFPSSLLSSFLNPFCSSTAH